MDRRDFFKIVTTTSAGALAGGCGRNTDKLIPMLVPEHEIVPGQEQWHPAVCTECGAGCGTLVRVMEAVRTVELNGEKVGQRIAAVKKVEGNPLDPVSGGRLCARGQATVQALYHPDRLRGPMKRTGDRGKAQFAAVTWDEALGATAEAIKKGGVVTLTQPIAGTRSLALQRFLQAAGAPAPTVCSLADFAVERKAAETVFGWNGLPLYDIANADFVLSVGADFLGGWVSPVYYARQFGNFRQGRRHVRGTLVHAESRLSITAGAADRWLPLRPGSEPQFLSAVATLLADRSADIKTLLAACGLPENRVREVAQGLAEAQAPLVIGGASVVQTNSLDAVVMSHHVNQALGNVGKKGGVLAPASPAAGGFGDRRADEALKGARVVILDDVNPAYTLPQASGVLDALSRAEMVIALSSFLDDSGAFADLLLPVHHALESEIAVVPAVSPGSAVSIGMPFVEPLYDTRAPERIWFDVARRMGLEYQAVTAKEIAGAEGFEEAARRGGAWGEARPGVASKAQAERHTTLPAEFEGDYPLYFQPYLSLQFHDGRGANLPWLQELPDPASSGIWGLPVEIDPGTAKSLRVENGDIVRVQSQHGSIDAPAYVHPGAVPGVVSMPIGDGHTHYGRYASARGANPLAILAPVYEKSTGALAFGATRVRLARAGGRRDWIQFAAPDREEREYGHR